MYRKFQIMRHLLRIAFLLIFTIFISSCNHNPVIPTVESIEYEHILEDYFVVSIAFDHKGTAWIGTLHQGLVRYDEDVFHYNSSNSILPDSFMVLAIEVDSLDNVWIGSSIGLIKHNDNQFIIFDKSNSPVYYNIYSLALDNDNSIWFTNGDIYQGGVIQYTGRDWNLYTPDNSELPSTIINDISVDKKNNKWFTCYGAVVKYFNNNWTIFNSSNSGINLDWGDQITLGINEDVWISCDYSISSRSDDYPEVIKFDGKNWIRMDPPKEISIAIANDIFCDSKGNIWLATSVGELIYYNRGKWNYYCKLPSSIFAIEEDNSGHIWLGTGKGIYIMK